MFIMRKNNSIQKKNYWVGFDNIIGILGKFEKKGKTPPHYTYYSLSDIHTYIYRMGCYPSGAHQVADKKRV